MRKMEDLMEQKGVVHHDRVGQPEMESWYKKCGIWAYPSHFYEINCISAIKAQLWGAVPITTNYAALKQTVQFGKKIEGEVYDNFGLSPELKENYKKELILALKDPEWQKKERVKMMKWARDKYGWDKIVKELSSELKGVS